jgi:hypothetical protein
MARGAKEITITTTGKPLADDLFVRLIATALANQPQLKLVASDGKIVEKKKTNNRR